MSYTIFTREAASGLTLLKSITGMHGGSISLESALGVGTTVTPALPLGQPDV